MIEFNNSAESDIQKENIVLTPTIVQEGKAKVTFSSSLDVFYNPVQEFNRDISIAVLRVVASDYRKIKDYKSSDKKLPKTHNGLDKLHLKPVDFDIVKSNSEILPAGVKQDDGIRILEALSASGLRSIRYALEVGGVKEILTNDYSDSAVNCIKKNITLNNVEELVFPSLNDANLVMYSHRETGKRFHVVDIDPYGSPHTFLETAVQSVEDGGILLVTATDMAVLCGKSPETCYAKYGAISIPINACHEMALRILLQTIEHHANKYGRYIQPLLSLSIDFYCRIVVRIFTSKKIVKESFTKIGMMHFCVGCEAINVQPLGHIDVKGKSVKYLPSTVSTCVKCEHCGYRKKTGGPLWLEALHDTKFVKRLNESLVENDFNTFKRLKGMLTLVEEELDVPFYMKLDKVYQLFKTESSKITKIMSPLLNAGYNVSYTHAQPNCIKTDAPMSVFWDVFRELVSNNPPIRENARTDTPSDKILAKASETKIDFTMHPYAEYITKDRGLIKFQVNPEKFWGPKSKAKTSILYGEMQSKSVRKQGKRKRYKIATDYSDSKKTKET